MGRPVVTVEGGSLISRQSAAILRAAGVGELVARNVDGMAALAVELAADRRRLADLCAGLRPRLAASPACDAAAFVRKLEAAYREAWRSWCAGRPVGDDP
jgi:predicted O-linked N-acetylglucosamine transferase (SPINDLY family)